jgi:maltose/moltooligosaccharide transporter
MCFGFLGIQFGFALQNANVSRIFQTLGASIDDIPILWIAAPLTGLIVQPIVGLSLRSHVDGPRGVGARTSSVGAVLASLALFAMPNSPGAVDGGRACCGCWTASINISMEPFRAFVGDQLPVKQRATGYAMQSFFIGIGSVIASMLPWLLRSWAWPTPRVPAKFRRRCTTPLSRRCGPARRHPVDGVAHARVSAGAPAGLG